MVTVKLERNDTSDEGTIGTIHFEGCVLRTIELPWRNNARQLSCIPGGDYKCEIVKSPKFGDVYQLLNVPRRTAILIHPANFAGDVQKGWQSELLGCIAVCQRIGSLRNSRGAMQQAGLGSKSAFDLFMRTMHWRPFDLEIT